MIRTLSIGVLACTGVLLLQVPALAQRAAPSSPPCLRQGQIYDFQLVPGNRSLVVTDLARQRYRLNFIGKCYNLQHQFGLRFKTFGVGSLSCVEKGDSVLLHDPVGPGECIIKSIQLQTSALDRADLDAVRAAGQR